MTDSSDKKSKEKIDSLNVDLDAMQDEGEWPAFSMNEFQDDDEAIDRLLMNTDLDADDTAEQPNVEIGSELEALDDFSDFSDFDEPEMVRHDAPLTASADQSDQVMGDSAVVAADDVDDFFGLGNGFGESDLIQDDEVEASAATVADLTAVNEEPQSSIAESGDGEDALGALDDFSDFSDFDEPGIMPSAETEEAAQVTEDLSFHGHDAEPADEADDFSALSDDFDESDLIQDDEAEASAATVADLIAVNEEPQASIAESGDGEDGLGALDDFSDFSDFDEPGIMPSAETGEVAQATEDLSFHGDDADPSDEVDDFSALSDDFDESDLIQDDEAEASATTVADLIAVNEEPQASIEELGDDEDALDALDDFLDFSDFDKPGIMPSAETGEVAQVTEDLSFHGHDADSSDEVDDFSALSDDFDESDLIQDDEVEVSAGLDEQSSDGEGATDSLLLDAGFDSANALEKTDETADDLFDDDSLLDDDVDGFDDSDMIQIDEVDDWADLVTSIDEPVKEPLNDLLDDENDVDSLLLDSVFDAEDALEETSGEKYEFGDEDLTETDDFFQSDEVVDDFSSQPAAVQLAETEMASMQDEQEDDFLLPDFDITAGTEISDMGSDLETKEDEIGDGFGNIDFLNEEDALNVFGTDALGGNDAIVEPESKQAPAVDTIMSAIEDAENLKLSPFGFEQEDIKNQLADAESKVKKAKLFSYVALGFGAIALSAAVGLGVITYGTKAEFSKLTEEISTLQASLAKSAENSSNIVVKQDMVSKELDTLQVKMGGLEDKVSLTPALAEPVKVEDTHEPAPVKAANVSEPAKTKTGAEQEPALSKETSHKITPAPAKEEAVPVKTKSQTETVKAKEKKQPEAVPAKAKAQPEAVAAEPIAAAKNAVKPEPVKEKKQAAPGKWGVNLGAFKQEWFAKSKAAEYAQQGVFAEVIPVHEKNTTMYRLRVAGFKTKAEADSNTARIKKALNLDSVWVNDN